MQGTSKQGGFLSIRFFLSIPSAASAAICVFCILTILFILSNPLAAGFDSGASLR